MKRKTKDGLPLNESNMNQIYWYGAGQPAGFSRAVAPILRYRSAP